MQAFWETHYKQLTEVFFFFLRKNYPKGKERNIVDFLTTLNSYFFSIQKTHQSFCDSLMNSLLLRNVFVGHNQPVKTNFDNFRDNSFNFSSTEKSLLKRVIGMRRGCVEPNR